MHLLTIHICKTMSSLLLDVYLFRSYFAYVCQGFKCFAFDSCVFHSTVFSYSVSIVAVINKLWLLEIIKIYYLTVSKSQMSTHSVDQLGSLLKAS